MKLKTLFIILIVISFGCLGSPDNTARNPPIDPDTADSEDFKESVKSLSEKESLSVLSSILLRSSEVRTDGVIILKINKTSERYRINYYLFEEEWLQYYSNNTLYTSLVFPGNKQNSTTNTTFSERPYKPELIEDVPVSISDVNLVETEEESYKYNMSYRINVDEVPREFSSLKEGTANITLSENGEFKTLEVRENMDESGRFHLSVTIQEVNNTTIKEPEWVKNLE